MSLQVWLPLNGTFENHGLLGPLTQTTAPAYVNGKLGKALSTGGCKMSASQTASVLNNKAVSICFWVYINAATGTKNAVMFFGTDTMSTANNRKFSLFNYPTINDLHWSWQNDVANNVFTNGVLSGVFPSYQWTHVAVTYENPNGTIYINGIKKQSFTGVSSSSTFAYETQVLYNSTNTYKNDFRIYDHCLSAREVKEISKGLFLHYKIGGVDGYFGGRNLIPNSYKLNGKWSAAGGYAGTTTVVADSDAICGYHIESKCTTAGSGPHYPVFSKTTDKIGKTYTWSFEAKCSSAKSAGNIGHECGGIKSIALTTTWTKYTHTWTFTDSQYHSFVFYPGFAVGDILYIRDFKIEEGTKATSWTPAPEDNAALYNTTTEFDTSGFGNNGTITGTITSDGTSPRYDICYKLSNNATYINTTLTTAGFTNSYTIAYWAKKANMTGCMAFGFADGNRLNVWPSGGTICWNTGDSENNPFQNNGTSIALSTYNNGAWHHYAVTGNSSTTTLYIDGTAVGTAKTYKAITGTQLYISGWNTSTNYKWTEGSICDFRMYSTALSATDVKELYNTPISLTNTGTLMTQGEFKEV